MKMNSVRLFGALAGAAVLCTASASAQVKDINVALIIPQSGPVMVNVQPAQNSIDMALEEVNAKGVLLGRPVKLIYYDDQSQSAPVPGIYTKLMDVDKVDLVIGPYATVPSAAAMPASEAASTASCATAATSSRWKS